jgi:hypothetical protein
MSTPVAPEKKTPPGSVPPSGGVTVFLKPCFGISVQSNSLSVAVSARPPPVDTGESSPAGAVDDSIPCP